LRRPRDNNTGVDSPHLPICILPQLGSIPFFLEAIGENSNPYLGSTIQRLTLYLPLGPQG